MSDEEPSREGEVIAGKYRLTKRLGGGGMGDVYRAVNEMVNREVAIKVLKPEYAKMPDVVQRVLREARAANAVRHPNVVDVLDVCTDEAGAPVIVQELLSGGDLSAHLGARGGVLSEAEALEVITPVAEAVAAAHNAGIMHRDLKLENVFMARQLDGRVVPKVLDFGLSRAVGENAVSRLTATGVAMGTPMYMSPEQVQGQRDVDQRTDVWALGVMLYELVAGRLPFTGDSLGAVFVKICTSDPDPLRALAPAVSETYQRVVAKCLQRDRAARYETAAALAEELRLLRRGATTSISGTPLGMGHGQTIVAAPNTFGAPPSDAAAPGTTLQPVGARPMAQSIGPTVSSVPDAPRRRGPLLAIAAAVGAAVLAVGAWAATRSSEPPTPPAPHAAPRAATPPTPTPTPAPPPGAIARGTAAYDADAAVAAPTQAPARAYDADAAAPPTPAQAATPTYDHAADDDAQRNGRRRVRGRGRVRAPGVATQVGGRAEQAVRGAGGTATYDGD